MTPEDVAAIRAEWADSFLNGDPLTEQIRTLCDALEEAWRSNVANGEKYMHSLGLLKMAERVQRERAERAELELSEYRDAARKDVDRLIVRAGNAEEAAQSFMRRMQERSERMVAAEAALARVRDLCDERGKKWLPNSREAHVSIWRVHAAIAGDPDAATRSNP